MECPTILNLKLDQSDIDALETIRKIRRNEEFLKAALPAGVLATIFLGNKSPEVMFSVHNTDFVAFASAMATIPSITRRQIIQQAQLQQLKPRITPQQRQFWRAIESGCKAREYVQ